MSSTVSIVSVTRLKNNKQNGESVFSVEFQQEKTAYYSPNAWKLSTSMQGSEYIRCWEAVDGAKTAVMSGIALEELLKLQIKERGQEGVEGVSKLTLPAPVPAIGILKMDSAGKVLAKIDLGLSVVEALPGTNAWEKYIQPEIKRLLSQNQDWTRALKRTSRDGEFLLRDGKPIGRVVFVTDARMAAEVLIVHDGRTSTVPEVPGTEVSMAEAFSLNKAGIEMD